jgi:hypothetical protein
MRYTALPTLFLLTPLAFACDSSITVTSPADSGFGSFRQAVSDVCDGGTITFQLPAQSTIFLTSGPIAVAKSVAITGPNRADLAIDGGGGQILITSGSTVSIQALTLQNAYTSAYDGSAIINSGSLQLTNVRVTGSAGLLGPVNNKTGASMTVKACLFDRNVGRSVAAVENAGSLLVQNSTFESNTSANSGALDNQPGGVMTVEDSKFTNNSSTYGSGIANGVLGDQSSQTTIRRCAFYGNHASYAAGAVYNGGGSVLISQSTISQNTGQQGGALGNLGGATMTIEYSTVDSNHATGAALDFPTGGGIRNDGIFVLRYSAVTNNISNGSGGGFTNAFDGTFTILRSTFYGNQARSAQGGAISAVFAGRGVIAFSTIVNNSDYFYNAGGVATQGSRVNSIGTIIANNPTGNCDTTALVTRGFNISSDATCGFSGATDISGTDPLLGPLALNGGVTLTLAPMLGSPAIDSGGTTGCSPSDQRGVPAPQNGICDRGAYEAAAIRGSMTYQYAANDASKGSFTYLLLENNTWSDGVGGFGGYNYQPGTAIVLTESPSTGCQARSTGRVDSTGLASGTRVCQDGSGVKGRWSGAISVP